MSVTELYLANNRAYASRHTGPLPKEPSQRVAVVACMDARQDIYAVLGLKEGEASVIRNAGGVITEDVIRSLAVSQQLLGTDEIMLIHHTDCRMLTYPGYWPKGADPQRVGASAPLAGGVLPRRGSRRTTVPQPRQGEPVPPPPRIRTRFRAQHRHGTA